MVELNCERINQSSPYKVEKEEDGFVQFVTNYTALIVKSDNPNLPTIAEEFTRTVQLLCDKPD